CGETVDSAQSSAVADLSSCQSAAAAELKSLLGQSGEGFGAAADLSSSQSAAAAEEQSNGEEAAPISEVTGQAQAVCSQASCEGEDMEEDYDSDNTEASNRGTDLYSLLEINQFMDETYNKKAVKVNDYFLP
ncbi:hypothetical protein ABVT39_022595, partial [Epinephelus coioides]